MQNTQPQNNQPNLNEQASTQKVSKNWLYASILLGIVLLLAFLSGKLQAISIKGVFILVGGYIGYLFFNKWLEMMKEPSLEKFVKLCNEYNKKHNGGFLDDRLQNIYCDERYFFTRICIDRQPEQTFHVGFSTKKSEGKKKS